MLDRVLGALAADRPSYVLLAPAPFVAWLVWRQAAARMAFVVVGGLLVSQTLTLYVTPVFYTYMEAMRERFSRRALVPDRGKMDDHADGSLHVLHGDPLKS